MIAPLTDSERTLAVMLDAWNRCPNIPASIADEAGEAIAEFSTMLFYRGYVANGVLLPKGRDLLDRARAAGVLSGGETDPVWRAAVNAPPCPPDEMPAPELVADFLGYDPKRDGRRLTDAEFRARTDVLPRDPSEECTGISAGWCPVHGDCTCPRDDTDTREGEDQNCPLHGIASNHGDEPQVLLREPLTEAEAHRWAVALFAEGVPMVGGVRTGLLAANRGNIPAEVRPRDPLALDPEDGTLCGGCRAPRNTIHSPLCPVRAGESVGRIPPEARKP